MMAVRGFFAGGMLIFLGSLIGLAFVVVIWVLVAKDAKEQDISPSGLWGAIAALVPGFIGLVGYMVVRYIAKWNKNNGSQE